MDKIRNKYSILVCSCDKNSDLWVPFFTLFKKYWGCCDGVKIYLNTESIDFYFDGLDIECIHSTEKNVPYGRRMKEALTKINSKYVIPFLDDFFLRDYIDRKRLEKIIEYMDADKHIVCMNQDCLETYIKYEYDCYTGYKRIPIGNYYTLNMQVGVWRTKRLYKYWKENVSPWEWEICCNPLTFFHSKDKFYCLTDYKNSFCNYGYCTDGMGIVRGKWVENDVVPFFTKEGIQVDYSIRGFYNKESDCISLIRTNNNRILIKQSLGLIGLVCYYMYLAGKTLFRKKEIFMLDFFIFLHVFTQTIHKKSKYRRLVDNQNDS